MTETSKPTLGFTWQHGLVIGVGLLVFVLLFIADKTNLKSDEDSRPDGNGQVIENYLESWLALFPTVENSEDLAARLTALQESENAEERKGLLIEVVNAYRNMQRFDIAAAYAGVLAEDFPDTDNYRVAGALFRNANMLPASQADSTLFRQVSDEAIRLLNEALELNPGNEDAKIELGLAIIESRPSNPQESMQGVLKIREVVEANPENIDALMLLGNFSLENAMHDKAEGRFRSVLELEPENHRARFLLAQALGAQGKTDEQKTQLEQVAAQSQDPAIAERAKAALGQ